MFDSRFVRGVGGPLHAFNRAGLLSTSDIHVALRLSRLGAIDDDVVALGAAFAARAPRLGNVCVDLATIHATADADTEVPADLGALPWPDPATWVRHLVASPVVGVDRPLHVEGSTLYLDRLWADECLVAAELGDRSDGPAAGVDVELLTSGLEELFAHDDDPEQRMAAATAVLRRLSVIAGGPGTGKTTTVARVLALLEAQAIAMGERPPLVALAAPTGKAAARLEDAVRQGADAIVIDQDRRDHLQALAGKTIHRLLGFNPGNRTRFRHNRLNRLPHDVVVVDETSMVSLSLMARLLEAVRPDARLILVGDPEQLASVEAGAVLGDIVGPAALGPCMPPTARRMLAEVTGRPVPGGGDEKAPPFGAGIVVLRHVHRHGVVRRGRIEALHVVGGGRFDRGQGRSIDGAPLPPWRWPSGRATPTRPWSFSGPVTPTWSGSPPTKLTPSRPMDWARCAGSRSTREGPSLQRPGPGRPARPLTRLAASACCAVTGAGPKGWPRGWSTLRIGSGPTSRGSPPVRTGMSGAH